MVQAPPEDLRLDFKLSRTVVYHTTNVSTEAVGCEKQGCQLEENNIPVHHCTVLSLEKSLHCRGSP